MPLVTRQEKGSKLSIQEMDGNLEYLQANGFVDGQYTRIEPSAGIIEGVIDDNISYNPNPLLNASTGSYRVILTTLTGNGAGAEFDLEVVETNVRGEYRFNQESFVINTGGSGYAVGDTIAVPYSEIGGISVVESDVVTFTLQEGSVSGQVETIVAVSEGQLSVPSILTSNLEVKIDADDKIFFQGLPTEDPMLNGQLWNDSGSLKISAGE
jgi:hypothetical protein